MWVSGNNSANLDCTSFYTWEQVAGTNNTIQFNNQSTGEFNTWSWSFGDGTTSGIYNPEHEYSQIGVYYVCLTIGDGISCNDTFCDTVVVSPDCHADFDFSYVPTTPTYVQFTDASTGYPNSWLWHFGDGSTSNEQNPVHPYYDPGVYEVCLVIEHSDSLYYCLDSICKTVIIPDTLECEAIYSYNISEEDPMEVHFTDESNGNITDWEWNFGDGVTSNEQNPVHAYAEEGEYLVCLKVEHDDSLEYCIHFICETIILEGTIVCEADFVALADSNSNVMYRYSFIDQSIGDQDGWHWTFGDGNISQEQNPVHIYDQPGTYEVCLHTWNSNYPGCTDTYCILVKTAEYFQLGGLAFVGENPMNNPYPAGDTGLAILYRQRSDQSVVAVDTNTFFELGYYWFSNMMEMDYMIRIGLSPGSVHYKDFVPSYFPGSMSWQDADVFMLNDNLFEMNTNLLQAYHLEVGPGMISGRVVSGNRNGVEAHASFHDVPVILTDLASTPLEWTTTDEYGSFEFRNIALGSYLIHADVAGIWSQPESVALNESFPTNDSVLIKMYYTAPFAITEPLHNVLEFYSLYPNPVSNNFTFQLSAEQEMFFQFDIINLTGQRIKSDRQFASKGINTYKINTEGLPAGIYLINVTGEGQRGLLSKKFVKK